MNVHATVVLHLYMLVNMYIWQLATYLCNYTHSYIPICVLLYVFLMQYYGVHLR